MRRLRWQFEMMSPGDHLHALWTGLGGDGAALAGIQLSGADPVLPSSFRVGMAAQLSIVAAATAARELGRRRLGIHQELSVDALAAAIECRSERLLRINGKQPSELWDAIAGIYPCRHGRHVRLHTNFAHHRAGIIRLLGCRDTKSAVAEALVDWEGEAFESAATAAGMVVSYVRTFEEWDRHPQRAAIAAQPLVHLTKIGEAPGPRSVSGERPIDDLRVLEMTRIIAAPVAGRVLAAHGADVFRVIAPELPTIEALDIDSGRGKRSAFLNIAQPADTTTFTTLLQKADIFLQSYRPGILERLGYGADHLASLRPGLIIARLSAYGRQGPWAGKRGFDSLVQAATGFNLAEANAAGEQAPRPLPMQILDHASGYLLAFGALMARLRQLDEGGTWQVDVSLARTGNWLRDLGQIDDGFAAPEPSDAVLATLCDQAPSGYGMLTFPRHAARLTHTPARWVRPSVPFGSNQPHWVSADETPDRARL